jgi:GNAT superfamily N-acetyltransferase
MIGVSLVPYQRAHADFVVGSFGASIRRESPWSSTNVRAHMDALERVLRDPGTRALVAIPTGHADDLIGWAVQSDGALVFAYVRYALRGQGIGRALLDAAFDGIPEGITTPVVYWTRAATRYARAGHRYAFDTEALDRIARLAHTERDAA